MITLVLDMDQTFYDPHAPFWRVQALLHAWGFVPRIVEETLNRANAEGYSFEYHLELLQVHREAAAVIAQRWGRYYDRGERYLLPGVEAGVVALSPHVHPMLVTFGNERFQRQKWNGLPEAFRARFAATHFVLAPKGPTLAAIVAAHPGAKVVYAEDSPSHLLSVREHAPTVRCVRMMWPQFKLQPHPGDSVEWQVATNFDELVNLLPAP